MSEKTKILLLSAIEIDPEIQPRAKGLDEPTVIRYMEAALAGEDFPPCVVYFDPLSKTHRLSEGFHRHEAFRRANIKQYDCIIRQGDRRDARLNACGSNSTHGLARSNADKRRAVEIVIEEYPSWSNPRIAKIAAVSAEFVRSVRPTEQDEAREGSDGKSQPATKKSSQVATVATCEDENPGENADSDPQSEPESVEPDAPPATVKPPTQVDQWGIPIQPHATEAFAAIAKFKELTAAIREAQRLFNECAGLTGGKFLTLPEVSSYRRGAKQEDGTYADRFVHDGLERAAQQVKNAIPAYTVCPYQYADAPHPEGTECRCCHGLLWAPALSDSTPKVCIDRAKAALTPKQAEV